MASKMIVALLVVCPLGAMAGSCPDGYKFKAALGNMTCSSSSATAATCMNCCEKDVTLCGGNTVTCAVGFFLDSTKATSAIGTDAGVTNCCTAKATCADFTCVAPMATAKTAAATTTCSGLVATCLASTCCLASDHCGAKMVTCGTGKFQDSAKATAAWTAANEVANCCSAKAKCSATSTCTSAWKIKDATKDTVECSGLAASCSDSACCKNDMTKCAPNVGTITCDSGMSMTAAKMAMAGTDKAACCETTPTVTTTTAGADATCTAFQSAGSSSSSGPGKTSGAKTPEVLAALVVSLVAALWK